MVPTDGVSFKSTFSKFADDSLDDTRPVYAIVELASAISIATVASAGKKRRAKATETKERNVGFLIRVSKIKDQISFPPLGENMSRFEANGLD